ncbi:unnamed protein product, partial [Sphagnum compactum]
RRMDQQEGSRANRPTGMGLPGRGDNPKHRQRVRIQENLPHGSHPSHRIPHYHHPPGGVRTCQEQGYSKIKQMKEKLKKKRKLKKKKERKNHQKKY